MFAEVIPRCMQRKTSKLICLQIHCTKVVKHALIVYAHCNIFGSLVFCRGREHHVGAKQPDRSPHQLGYVVLNWNFSVGSAFFRQVSFARIREGGDQTIGLIIRDSSRSDKIVILDDWVRATGRFEIRTPATLFIRNVTADDTSFYEVEVQSLEGVQFRSDKSVIYLNVLGELSTFIYLLVCSVLCSVN